MQRSYFSSLPIQALFVAMAAPCVAQSAAAERPSDVRQVEVHYGDLNLDKTEGAATLLRRLSFAARTVCDGSTLGSANLRPKNRPSVCRKATLQKAVSDVNHPLLTAMYESTRGGLRMRLARK